MSTLIRSASLVACPVHQVIRQACSRKLLDDGFFSKKAIIEECNMQAMAASIRWQYIVKVVGEDFGCELLALKKRFFFPRSCPKNEMHYTIQTHPEKFIGVNHSQAWGYGDINARTGELATKRLERRKNAASGLARHVSDLHTANVQHGIGVDETVPVLPAPPE